MLRPPESGSYSGWSSAYGFELCKKIFFNFISVQSILVQLQTFLMAENIPQDHGEAKSQVNAVEQVDKTKQEIDKFVCKKCSHKGEAPYPPLPPPELVSVI